MTYDKFISPETGDVYLKCKLSDAESETQKEFMLMWFYENYEDPAERTPYEKAEGGYQWIWGGPYDAMEVLSEEFDGIVPHHVISELVKYLEAISVEWAPAEKATDYDDYLYDVIAQQPESSARYLGAIAEINKLLYANLSADAAPLLYKLLYVNVLSALETFLSEIFITAISSDPKYFRKYVESSPIFMEKKIPLSSIYCAQDTIESDVRSSLVEMVWHNLRKIGPLFKSTFNVMFPDNLDDLYRAILLRHDIVHRNGKTKDGSDIAITQGEVRKLIEVCGQFVNCIERQMPGENQTPVSSTDF